MFGPIFIIFDGDSITQGFGTSPPVKYPPLATSLFPLGYGSFANISVSGETFATMVANEAANVYPLIASAHAGGQQAACSCFAGTNDIAANGQTSAQVFASATSYFQGAKTHGADLCFGWTLLPRQFTGFEATRIAFNTMMRVGFTTIGIDFLVDIGRDPSLGNVNAVFNPILFQPDGIHPTNFGQQLIAYHCAASMLQVGSSCSVAGISPSSGTIAGGTPVSITGAGFTGATVVLVGGLPVASFTVESDILITARTAPGYFGGANPLTYFTGPGDVDVISPLGGSVLTAGFTYTLPGSPSGSVLFESTDH